MENRIPYKDVLEHLAEGVYFVTRDRQIQYWNKAAEKITGYSRKEVLGRHCWDNILMHLDEHGKGICRSTCPLHRSMEQNKPQQAQVFLRHKQGHRIPVLVKTVPVLDEKGSSIGAVELFEDNSADLAVAKNLKALEALSLLDPLTEISNRRHMEILLAGALEQKKRYDSNSGLIFMDVDDFKKVNDTYGHRVGDEVLKMIARNLMHRVRIFDTPGRWGGEELILLCQHVEREELADIADRIRILIESSRLATEDQPIQVTVSLGATMALPTDTIASLIARADSLMYQSKKNGKNQVAVG